MKPQDSTAKKPPSQPHLYLAEHPPYLTITPKGTSRMLGLKELFAYRELLLFLTWRDIKVRYKQTVLGIGWAIIQPVFSAGVFTLFFGKLVKIPSDSVRYPLFALAALIPWTYFSTTIGRGTTCLVGNGHLISKVYFPRLLLPMAMMLPGLLDSVIAFIVLMLGMAYSQTPIPFSSFGTLVLLMGLTVVLAFSVTLWLAALNVRFRDMAHAVPFLIQLWMFSTPIVYPLSIVPDRFQWLVSLNPMVGIVTGFRSALYGVPWHFDSLWITCAVSGFLLVTGVFFFRRMENRFADLV